MPEKNDKNRKEAMKALSLLSQIGINIVVCVGVGIFLGRWLDGLLNTTPWLLLLFTFIGMGAAFKSIVDLGKR